MPTTSIRPAARSRFAKARLWRICGDLLQRATSPASLIVGFGRRTAASRGTFAAQMSGATLARDVGTRRSRAAASGGSMIDQTGNRLLAGRSGPGGFGVRENVNRCNGDTSLGVGVIAHHYAAAGKVFELALVDRRAAPADVCRRRHRELRRAGRRRDAQAPGCDVVALDLAAHPYGGLIRGGGVVAARRRPGRLRVRCRDGWTGTERGHERSDDQGELPMLHTRRDRTCGAPSRCGIKARARRSRELQSVTAAVFPPSHACFCGVPVRQAPDATTGPARCRGQVRHNVAEWSIG